MDGMLAIGEHAVGQPVHAARDLAMKRLLELARTALASRAAISAAARRRVSGAAELGFELGDPGFQSFHALSELAHVISAVPR